jgi:hypothetical protein
MAENLHDYAWVHVEIYEQRSTSPTGIMHRDRPDAGKLAAPRKDPVERPGVDR